VVLPETTLHPLAALEDALTDAVGRFPCCVAFSGGRDSSLVLAAAVRAAQRLGVPPPATVTMRFPGDDTTDEDAWQRLVLDHVGVHDRIVVDLDDELDFVGPDAAAELRRRGALFPANAHSLVPLLRHAAGGSLVVGLGGDEILGGYRWTPLNDVLARRRRPTLGELRRFALAALPASARARIRPRRGRLGPPGWLTVAAAERFRRLVRSAVDEPIRFDRAVRHSLRARSLQVATESLGRLSSDTLVAAPLVDPRFVSALAVAGGARGWGGRSAVMRAVAGDALPAAIANRTDKARFNAVFFGDTSRQFAREWSGRGIDQSLVDAEALRREWLKPKPDTRAALLLQIAWLHDHRVDNIPP
jgi:asparagine synthase (glutamine-hydrolysing)